MDNQNPTDAPQPPAPGEEAQPAPVQVSVQSSGQHPGAAITADDDQMKDIDEGFAEQKKPGTKISKSFEKSGDVPENEEAGAQEVNDMALQKSELPGQAVISNSPVQPSADDDLIEDMQDLDEGSAAQQPPSRSLRVADMSLEDKKAALKKYLEAGVTELKEGDYLDASDTIQKWRVARVVSVNATHITVNYDGWPSKWDGTFRFSSYKITNFRRHARGYTGQNGTPLRQNLSVDSALIVDHIKKVKEIIKANFQNLSAHETNQYIRGKLFVTVDYIMSCAQTFSKEDVDLILDFFKHVINLCIAWLRVAPNLFEKCIPLLKAEPDLFLVDEDCALYSCSKEIMGILERFFGGCHRVHKFFLYYDRNPTIPSKVTLRHEDDDFESGLHDPSVDFDCDELKRRITRRFRSGLTISFLDHFASVGGFEAFLGCLKLGNERLPVDPKTKQSPFKELIPFEFILDMITSMNFISKIVRPDFVQPFVKTILGIITERLLGMTERETKEFDKDYQSIIFFKIKDFLGLTHTDASSAEVIERIQIQLATKFLRSTYLEKRLKGLNEIQSQIERVDARAALEQESNNTPQIQYLKTANGQQIVPTKYLDQKIVKEWILNEKIPETIFGDGAHPEIFKRAAPFIRFLSLQNALTKDILELLWKQQEGKHEEDVRVLYGLINDIVTDLSEENLAFLYSKIASVKLNSEMHLTFLKDFTLKALEAARTSEEMTDDDYHKSDQLMKSEIELIKQTPDPEKLLSGGERLYGLPVLWDIVQDGFQPAGKKDLLTCALDSMCEILSQTSEKNIRVYYLLKAIANLKQGRSLYPSASIFESLVEGNDKDAATRSGYLLITLNETADLAKLVVSAIQMYNAQVKEALKSLARDNKSVDNMEEHIFSGRSPHTQTLKKMFKTLEFVVLKSEWKVMLQPENIDLLWQQFVSQPNMQSDQIAFLAFINKKRQKAPVGYETRVMEVNLFTPREQAHVFTQILCNPQRLDYSKMSSGLAKFFFQLFKLINRSEKSIRSSSRIEVLAFDRLVGLDSLWKILFNCKNEKVIEETRELLIELHLKLNNSQEHTAEVKQKVIMAFVEKSMQTLVKASSDNSEQKVLSILCSLTGFLDRYEGKRPIKPEMKVSNAYYQARHQALKIFIRKDGNPHQTQKQCTINQFETVGAVRARLADLFNTAINEINVFSNQGILDPSQDDLYVKDSDINGAVLVEENLQYSREGHPKFILAKNQAHFECLFSLLASSNPKIIEPAWQLLLRVPLNEKLSRDIANLQGADKDWNHLIDIKSTPKILYSLKIVKQQLKSKEAGQSAKQWKAEFVRLGGFKHLLAVWSGLQMDKIESTIPLKCIETLLETITELAQFDQTLRLEMAAHDEALVLASIRYIHLIGEYTLHVEKERGQSYEEILAKRTLQRLAKQKQKSLQFTGFGNDAKKKAAEDDSDEDEDEAAKLLHQLDVEFQSVRDLIESLFNFMKLQIFAQKISAIQHIGAYSNLTDLFRMTLVKTENIGVREKTGASFKEIIDLCSQDPKLSAVQMQMMSALIIDGFKVVANFEKRSLTFFYFCKAILECLSLEALLPIKSDLFSLASKLQAEILTRESHESNHKDQDPYLQGMLFTLQVLVQRYPELKKPLGEQLVPHLLHAGLFEIPHGTGKGLQSKPICKNIKSRQNALQLLATLSRDCVDNLKTVLGYLREFDKEVSWRTNKKSDWQLSHSDDEKSASGYCGIKNLGCICYIISLFQQFYMVPTLRRAILSVDDPNHDSLEPEENMFYQFQQLFMGLLKSEKQYVNPKSFCHSFKDWDGQPTNVYEQMDADEFYAMFLDRLETAIRGTPFEKTIQTHFGGKFCNEMICQGCPHKYDRLEQFLQISLPVKNKKSIQEGLESFIQGDVIDDYHCAKCDKKVTAIKRATVKEVPRFLTVALKRFEYDFDRNVRIKVNDSFEFPIELDLLPYTHEGITRKEKLEKLKQEAVEKGEEYEGKEDPLRYPLEYYQCRLKGVVVHTGTADSGHYYSFIRDIESDNGERWYEFNDNIVRDFDISELPSECFGGEDTTFANHQMPQMRFSSQKWRSAYLLIYERKDQTTEPIPDVNEDEAEPSTKASEAPKPKEEPEDVEDEEMKEKKSLLEDPDHPIQVKIRMDNQKYWMEKLLLGSEYNEFVSEITHYWNTANVIPMTVENRNLDSHITKFPLRKPQESARSYDELKMPLDTLLDLQKQHSQEDLRQMSHEVFQFAAKFYLTVLQRSSNKGMIPRFCNALKAYMNHDTLNAEWLIKQFSNWEIIQEMLLQTDDREMPKLAVGLVYCAMLQVYEKEKAAMNRHWSGEEGGCLSNFYLLLLSKLQEMKQFSLNLIYYFQLMARFASLGPEAREFANRAKTVGRCLDFFYGHLSPYNKDFQNMQELGKILETENPDIGMPTVVDIKCRSWFQQLQEKKRLEALADATPKYKFMIELVSLCARHIKFGITDKAKLLDPTSKMDQFITTSESELFFNQAKYMKKLFIEANRIRSTNYLAKAMVHRVYADENALQELFETVVLGLQDYDYDSARPFLGILFELLDEPAFKAHRSSWLSEFMAKVVEANQQYFKMMEVLFEFIFRLVSRNTYAREWFYKHPKEWEFLVAWVKGNPRPPVGQPTKGGVRLLKNRQYQMMSQYQDQYQNSKSQLNHLYRSTKLQDMLNGKVKDENKDPDLDKLDYQDFKYVVGDTIVYLDRSTDEASQGTVMIVIDEMIQYQFHNTEGDNGHRYDPRWIKCDTDCLLWGNNYFDTTRTRIRKQLAEQRKARAAEQQRMYHQHKDADAPQGYQGQGAAEGQSSSEEESENDEEAGAA